MSHKHYCVIDAENHYKHLVLVVDGEVQYYTLKDGETLADTKPPRMRTHSGENGFLSPIWNNEVWAESATSEEIAAWEAEHPAPEKRPPVPTIEDRVAELEDTTAALEDALCEMDAANEERIAVIEDALCEMDMG